MMYILENYQCTRESASISIKVKLGTSSGSISELKYASEREEEYRKRNGERYMIIFLTRRLKITPISESLYHNSKISGAS